VAAYDAVVVGAGVIGLSIAQALAEIGKNVLILERNNNFGQETSSRNSEVIHAGLYYPQGSLKAQLCVAGRHKLYEFCEKRHVPHRRVGKLIFAANPDQLTALEAIQSAGAQAGVEDLSWLDPREVKRLEPALSCSAALLSPSTGIISAHDYMMALLGGAEANGAMFVANTEVTYIRRNGSQWLVYIKGESHAVVSTPLLVNAAGLAAQSLATEIEGLGPEHVPALHLARGVYFSCQRKLPVTHLLYPIPVPGGLGTHLTLDLDGRSRFGPDVEWIDAIDYHVDASRRGAFWAAAKLIWPTLEPEDLVPGYAGIRPKIAGPGEPVADFVISTEADHGLPGLVNLFGIESPGLTSSLAIGDYIAAIATA